MKTARMIPAAWPARPIDAHVPPAQRWAHRDMGTPGPADALTTTQVAALVGYPVTTVRLWIRDHTLRPLGGSDPAWPLFAPSDVAALVRSLAPRPLAPRPAEPAPTPPPPPAPVCCEACGGDLDAPARPLEANGLRLSYQSWSVSYLGAPIHLTVTEFKILAALLGAAGRVLHAGALLRRVWGPEYQEEHHLLRVNMARIRARLDAAGAPPALVRTVKGIGYVIDLSRRPLGEMKDSG